MGRLPRILRRIRQPSLRHAVRYKRAYVRNASISYVLARSRASAAGANQMQNDQVGHISQEVYYVSQDLEGISTIIELGDSLPTRKTYVKNEQHFEHKQKSLLSPFRFHQQI
jgi:hypothetical protein